MRGLSRLVVRDRREIWQKYDDGFSVKGRRRFRKHAATLKTGSLSTLGKAVAIAVMSLGYREHSMRSR